MGDRGQVYMPNPGITLYTHWCAYELHQTVQKALQRGTERWDDPEYLARIIFCDMVRGDIDGTTAFGIGGPNLHGDVYRVVEVNTDKQQVKVYEVNMDTDVKDLAKQTVLWEGTFEEFSKAKLPEDISEKDGVE